MIGKVLTVVKHNVIFRVLGSRVLPLCGASSNLAWLSFFYGALRGIPAEGVGEDYRLRRGGDFPLLNRYILKMLTKSNLLTKF